MFKSCLTCNTVFEKRPNESKSAWEHRHKFCSRECANKAQFGITPTRPFTKGSIPWNKGRHPEYLQGSNHHNWKEKITKKCPVCSNTFYVKPSLDRVMFCSKICSNIFRKGQSPWNKGKADIICLQCGTTFTRTRKTSKYCSVHCFGQSQRGDKHRNWKGGKPKISRQKTLSYDEYRKYRDWQKAVFSRDKYKCVFCGASKVELHADHIKPYASHVDLRWEINNGRTLCVTCHRKTPTYGGNTRASKKDI